MDDNNNPHSAVARFYNEEYFNELKQRHDYSAHLKRIIDRLGVRRSQIVLDIGCGTGSALKELHIAGAEVYGIDLSEIAIRKSRGKTVDCHLAVGIAEALPFKKSIFDFIICLGSLEHFLDQPKALTEMARVARDGATLLVLVPNANFPAYRLGLYKGTDQASVSESFRTINEWSAMFSRAGMEIEKIWPDRHIISWKWISQGQWYHVPVRLIQAIALLLWPLDWQYQLYFVCKLHDKDAVPGF